jgi:hypothetical protein
VPRDAEASLDAPSPHEQRDGERKGEMNDRTQSASRRKPSARSATPRRRCDFAGDGDTPLVLGATRCLDPAQTLREQSAGGLDGA